MLEQDYWKSNFGLFVCFIGDAVDWQIPRACWPKPVEGKKE